MQKSFEQISKKIYSQLDITLRLIRINGAYAEKALAAHFAMQRDLLQAAKIQKDHTNEFSCLVLSEHGKILAEYGKTCFCNGIDYQKQMLSELSLK